MKYYFENVQVSLEELRDILNKYISAGDDSVIELVDIKEDSLSFERNSYGYRY